MLKWAAEKMAGSKVKAVCIAFFVAMLGGSVAQAQDSRSIGRLFFENDQRRILESIRQGLIDDDDISELNVDPIQVPLPQFETEDFDVVTDEQTGEIIRPRSYTLGGYIRSHSEERVRFTVGGGVLDSGNEEVFRRLGLKLQINKDGRIGIVDALTGEAHFISRGSVIQQHGGVGIAGAEGRERHLIVKR